jgi:putative intracellular protease/amidase
LLRSRTGFVDAKQIVRRTEKEDGCEKGDRVRASDAGRVMEGPDEEEKMNRKLLLLARAAVYLLAFVVPPVLISVVGVKSGLANRYEGPPAAAREQEGELPAPPTHDPDKPTAVVLLGSRGSEVTDVLAPYEVLSESDAFNVYAVAPKRKAVTLSGGLDVLPQLSLAELDKRLGGEDPDVVVVPAMWDVGSAGHRPVAKWLRDHAEGTGTVISVCDGAEVLADAGLLDGRRATANRANISAKGPRPSSPERSATRIGTSGRNPASRRTA